MHEKNLKAGDFSELSLHYSKNRPDYSPSVLDALIDLLDKSNREIDFADVGAGTGIWTRMVYHKGLKSVVAIEPNNEMLNQGERDSAQCDIKWVSGTAEKVPLETNSIDWVTMASSLHWTQFDLAMKEFWRILRPGGRFTALWNPRLIENNPLLMEIEQYIVELEPNLIRMSSGRSGITKNLTEKIIASSYFDDVIYLEGQHIIKMEPDRYIGAWRSVNDIQVQLGPKKFNSFIDFAQNKVRDLQFIEATYLTRAWSALKLNVS